MQLSRPSTFNPIVFLHIKVFSPLLSVLALEGTPYVFKVCSNKLAVVSALLFVEHCKNLISREYLSIYIYIFPHEAQSTIESNYDDYLFATHCLEQEHYTFLS